MLRDSITDVPGVLVGHAQDARGGTGCTVVLCGPGAVAGVDVRGGAPGTRETDCLDPSNAASCIHAIYLSGGSVFGLDGAGGVMRYLSEKKIGYDVGVCRVPLVPGAVIFDLTVGDHMMRPDAEMGYRACAQAGADVPQGNVGAGTGAGIGGDHFLPLGRRMMKGGLGTASVASGTLVVGALVVVNCFGDVIDPTTGHVLAGLLNPELDGLAGKDALLATLGGASGDYPSNTTIGVIATNARLDKAQARRVAMMAHDGLARTIDPIHTMHDGDSIFCLSMGSAAADVTLVGALAAAAMARAVVNAILHAQSAYGLPSHQEMREKLARRHR